MQRFHKLVMVFVFAIALIQSVFAQIGMQLATSQRTYMLYEPIQVVLRLRNDTGRPLVFGLEEDLKAEIYFEIQDRNFKRMEKYPLKPLVLNKGRVVMPGHVVDMMINLGDLYKFDSPGVYRIHAFIKHPQIKDTFRSNDVRFDVSTGSVYWSREIGLPESYLKKFPEKVSSEKSRFYRIKTLVDHPNKYFYCVLEDATRVYQIIRIGKVSGIEMPKMSVDMAGVLHILVPHEAKLYKYYQVDIDGALVHEVKYYKSTKVAPQLVTDQYGKVAVAGGDIAVPNVDYLVETPTYRAAQ